MRLCVFFLYNTANFFNSGLFCEGWWCIMSGLSRYLKIYNILHLNVQRTLHTFLKDQCKP